MPLGRFGFHKWFGNCSEGFLALSSSLWLFCLNGFLVWLAFVGAKFTRFVWVARCACPGFADCLLLPAVRACSWLFILLSIIHHLCGVFAEWFNHH